jgi:RND family efflux transporter MFP subunit
MTTVRNRFAILTMGCLLAGVCSGGALGVIQETAQASLTADARAAGGLGRVDSEMIARFQGHKAVSRPSHDALMGFSVPTVIKEILVNGGREVKEGELMVRGDDLEEVALQKLQQERVRRPLAVEAAQAEMELAKVEYERLRDILSRGGSGPQEVERARLTYEVRKIALASAESQQKQEEIQLERIEARVDRHRLKAPFDGVVDRVETDLGQAVSENEKIVRVVAVDPLWIDVHAPTDNDTTLLLQPGDRAWVLCDVGGQGRLETGKVIEVAPTADPASRTRRVRVEMPNPKGPSRLLAGEPVWVRFAEPGGLSRGTMTSAK